MRLVTGVAFLCLSACSSLGMAQMLPGGMARSGSGLIGGGSSFANPAMSRWSNQFHQATNLQVNYQSIGSGGGIRNFTNRTLDFGVSDGPMNEEQLAQAGEGVLHIPVTMGAVAICYNIPDLKEQLVLSGPVIADIYLGKITRWNDGAIRDLNPGVELPNEEIAVVRRADGSGTTFIFSDFLSKVSSEFRSRIGTGTTINVRVGLAARGNEGVSVQVQRANFSIGYVELLYAMEARVTVAKVLNAAGNAIEPSPQSVTAAAASITEFPDDLRMSITNPPGEAAYPLGGFVWVLARERGLNPEKTNTLRKFLEYILSDEGQRVATDLKYSRLPDALLELSRQKVARIQ